MGMPLDKRALDFGTTGNKINARHLPANFTATNYTPAQVASEGTDKVSAHLNGIDAALSAAGAVGVFVADLSFNGVVTQVDTTVSTTVSDATFARWSLHDNANGFEQIFCKITATSATNVRVNTNLALASGTYRLIGLEVL